MRMGRGRRLAAGGVGASMLLSVALLTPATAGNLDPIPDPKVTGPGALPFDVTGDAVASAERDRLNALLKPLDAYDGGMIWDPSNKVLTIQMTSDSALDEAQRIISAAATSLQTNFVVVRYSAKELNELADELLGNQAKWAGATGIGGGFDPKSNRVLLQVDAKSEDAETLATAIRSLNEPRVTLQVLDSTPGGAETRYDDYAPWSVGAYIESSVHWCGLGWSWKMWTTNEIVGSTARHCADLTWYNNGAYVGTVFSSRKAADSAFMHGSTYSPSVFVGDVNTGSIRQTVGIDSFWMVGDAVALSAPISGLHTMNVKLPSYTLPACSGGDNVGLKGVLMETHLSQDGDSGSPWLTTQSGFPGNAIAHGQHFGLGCLAGYTGSFFIKLVTISSEQGASIRLNN